MNDLAEWSWPTAERSMRAKVVEIEDIMRTSMQCIDLPVFHHFAKGVYGRELFIPKGTVLTGKIHKHANLNVLVCGDLSVLTEAGIVRVRPPFITVSPAGTKRIAYAHEDSIWLTVHGTDETDVGRIEEQFIAQSEAEYLDFCRALEEKKS